MFFTFEHSFMFFTTTKTLHKVNCDKLFKAGSGSALKKIAGSGSAKNECGSKAMTSTGIVFFLLKFIHVTDTHGISCGCKSVTKPSTLSYLASFSKFLFITGSERKLL